MDASRLATEMLCATEQEAAYEKALHKETDSEGMAASGTITCFSFNFYNLSDHEEYHKQFLYR